MTKQKIIQEAYVNCWEDFKNYVDENGFVNCVKNRKLSLIPYFEISEIEFNGNLVRPKSLQGIEDNNGWIKIESENDLPKKRGSFWTFVEGKEVVMNTFNTFDNMEFTFDNGKITHYQQLIKPNEPLY